MNGRLGRRDASQSPRRRHRPDYWLPVLATGLLGIGLVVVYAISPGISSSRGVSEGYFISKQILAITLGVVAFFVLSRVPYQLWRRAVMPLIIVSALAAAAVQFLGEEINGASRWVQIGGMSFQAAELIKFTYLVWLADLLAKRRVERALDDFKRTFQPILAALGIICVVVGVFQSDFGSTSVMIGMTGAMLFLAGVPLKRLAMAAIVVLVALTLLIIPSDYRRDRVATFFNPTADCQNTGYQSCQALIAVGSGGLFGLGLARSVQAFGYLPEAVNDSIFAILAESFGFLGVVIIIAMFAMLFSRLARISERAPDDFSRLLVIGIVAWFGTQAFINIGAMIGVLPLKGITLPFISYGGTSLLFVTGALGIAFQISRFATLGAVKQGATSNDDPAYRRGVRRPYYAAAGRRA